MWQCMYFEATFSIHPTLSFLQCVHKSVLFLIGYALGFTIAILFHLNYKISSKYKCVNKESEGIARNW